MASLMENLIEVLDLESAEYENLLGLSMKKTPVIVAGNTEELAKITDEEQNVVSKINRLDHKRQEVFTDIAIVINKDVNTLMLADLVEMLSARPQEQQKLAYHPVAASHPLLPISFRLYLSQVLKFAQ